ncbi:MAG: PASTA domain-containing protein [Acidimicrobiia bacterium]
MTGPIGLLVVAAAGVALGLVVGSTSGSTSGETTTSTSLVATTAVATSVPGGVVAEYESRIADLERQLGEARQAQEELKRQLLDYQVDLDPVQYAPRVGCDLSVAQPQDFSEKAEWIGPVGFYDFTNEFTNFDGNEIFLTVEAGESVTMVIPRYQRTSYSLLWDPSGNLGPGSTFPGSSYVTLEACPDSPTTFIGGFYVNNSLCGSLDLYFDDQAEPKRIALPFAERQCDGSAIPLLPVEPGPVPDVVGMGLADARLQIRLAGLVPAVDDGDPTGGDSVVWAQEPPGGMEVPIGSVIGFRTED